MVINEYELKVMLNSDEYLMILKDYKSESFFQKNYYFDTVNFDLVKNRIVVRIREKNGFYELTVKTQGSEFEKVGVISSKEKTVNIERKIAIDLISGKLEFDLPSEILKYGKLENIGILETLRSKVFIEGFPALELDKNMYLGNIDFELEWEINENLYEIAINKLFNMGINIRERVVGSSKYLRFIKYLKGENE